MAFKIAGSMALKEAARKADPVLLEPVMEFEVTTPEEFLGDVMGDVTARRGRIENIDERARSEDRSACSCRSPSSSATRPTCGRAPRVVPRTARCSCTRTTRCRRRSRKEIVARVTGE